MRTAPAFRLIERKPPRPGAILLALVAAVAGVFGVAKGLGHAQNRHFAADKPMASRSSGASGPDAHADEKDDDPNQVDTIVLGDAADAPVPARRGDRSKPTDVHPTILIRLPRYGEQTGLIPDSPAGHLLYGWLAAFNQGSSLALDKALPNVAPEVAAAAQMVLRAQTGGFNLVSAKEVQPGVLVFRLRDQTPEGVQSLGTLQMRPGSDPPEIASFSLRAIPAVPKAVPGR